VNQALMKKLLFITLISFVWCNVSLSKTLGTDKTVNDYLKEGYTLHSTDVAVSGYYLYHLVKGGSKVPLITCVYEIENSNTICWAP
jgi:hypothetical protein